MLHLWLTRGLLGLLSLGVVASFFAMGERISRQHAIIAGWVGAIWVEIFYFAARPSGDGIALTLTVPALCLAMRLRERPSMSLAGMLGLLLGLAFIVRFQYAPALALIGLLAVSGDPRRTLLPLAGSLVAIALGALADMAAGAPPLLWLWRNFAINLGENRSASFGTQPAWWFVTQIGATWHIAMLVLLPSLVAGARRFPFVALIALVVIASHSLIPHKEYRFVILAIALAVFLAAIGSVDLWKVLAGRWRAAERINATIALCVLWFLLSAVVGATKPFSAYWGTGARPTPCWRRQAHSRHLRPGAFPGAGPADGQLYLPQPLCSRHAAGRPPIGGIGAGHGAGFQRHHRATPVRARIACFLSAGGMPATAQGAREAEVLPVRTAGHLHRCPRRLRLQHRAAKAGALTGRFLAPWRWPAPR
jgi:hypothetical protein